MRQGVVGKLMETVHIFRNPIQFTGLTDKFERNIKMVHIYAL